MERMAEIKITRFDNHPSGALGRLEYDKDGVRWGVVIDSQHRPHFWCSLYDRTGANEVGTSFVHEMGGEWDTLPHAIAGMRDEGLEIQDGRLVVVSEANQCDDPDAAYAEWIKKGPAFADEFFGGQCPHGLIHE